MNCRHYTDCPHGTVVVDAAAMQKLTVRYTEYRKIVDRDLYDPLMAMQLAGGVLASVREIIGSEAEAAIR